MPVSAQKSRIIGSDFSLSAYVRNVSAAWTADMHDVSALTDTAKQFIVGQDTGTLTIGGLYDTAEHAELAAWKSSDAQPISYAPRGFTLGYEVWMSSTLESSLELSSSVSGLNEFSLNGQADGIVDMGVSLHDLAAVTADESGTGVDGTAATTGGGVAHLHVTEFSGFSAADVIIEDSANNTDWATIGTLTTVAATTSQRLVIAGTIRRYTRYSVDVTGTGSITFAVALARR